MSGSIADYVTAPASAKPTLLTPRGARGATPLDEILGWLRRRMPEFGGRSTALADRVLVVRAETGSGKSTVLPVGVFRLLRDEKTPARLRYRGPGVVCTQPRVLTAVALATAVSSERFIGGARVRLNPDMVLGATVGYQTGPLSSGAAGLTYATAGVLAAQLRAMTDAEFMDRYRFVIVDEAHERAVDTDVLLMMLRNFYRRNEHAARLPFLILASATFDPAVYARYFGLPAANVFEVAGRQHPVTTHWPEHGANDYLAEAAAVAARIHEAHPGDAPARADVLVFVPGAAETEAVVRLLHAANRKYLEGGGGDLGPMLVLTLSREVVIAQSGDFDLVFLPPDRLPDVGGRRPARRVIVSTVVAETGLTIDTLRYVVDCGWSRAREVYFGAEGLVTRPAPQSRVRQRMGRVGRLFPGDFYPLYTERTFAALDPQQLPEILTAGPAGAYLALVAEQQRQKRRAGARPDFRVEDLGLLDAPAPEALLLANATATALGLVAARAGPDALYGLTPLGELAAGFTRTGMEGARVLLAGGGAAAADLLTAVAAMGAPLKTLYSLDERAGAGALPPGARALRAALPPFLAERAGGAVGLTGPLPPAASEAFYFRARLLFADEFVEAVLIFDMFARRLEGAEGDLAAVSAWCAGLGLSYGALVELARRRDELAAEMAAAGLDPFRHDARRLAAAAAADFMPAVAAFKQCLYDGLRARLLRYSDDHPDGPGYVSLQGLRVAAPPLLADAPAARLRAIDGAAPAPPRPRWILTDAFVLRPAKPAPRLLASRAARGGAARGAPMPLRYELRANLFSVLDGFVEVDPTFMSPRAPL